MKKVTKIAPTVPFTSETRKLRVAAYCRVSTDNDEQLESLETQVRHYESVIRANPEWTFAGAYIDEGITGTKKDRRPGLLKMIADCEERKIDFILTKSISRFSRNTSDCLELVRKLLALGIFIQFEKENIHTGSMDSELMLSILSGLAANESVSISENNKWSVTHRFQNGAFRISCPPYGYDAVEGKLVVNEGEAAVVRFIFAQVLSGKGAYTIAKELNRCDTLPRKGKRWSESTVRGMIGNEAYAGDTVLQKTFTDASFNRHKNYGEREQYLANDHHAAIVSRTDYDTAQIIVERHGKEKGVLRDLGKYQNRYPFSGRIVCAQCGSTFKRRTHGTGRKYIAWCCSTHLTESEKCFMKFILETDLEDAFVTMINKLIYGYKDVLKPLLEGLRDMNADSSQADIYDVELKLEENVRQQKVLVNLRSKGYLDSAAYGKGTNELLQEAKRLKSQKDALARSESSGNQHLHETGELLRYATKAELMTRFGGDVFKRFVERIHVYSRTEIGFELKCEMTLKEHLERSYFIDFQMVKGTQRFDNPIHQAEYAYSLIKTEVEHIG